MKHTCSIAAIQAARATPEYTYAPLEGFIQNRIAAMLDGLPALAHLSASNADVARYAVIREAVEAAYRAGFGDSRLTLGEL